MVLADGILNVDLHSGQQAGGGGVGAQGEGGRGIGMLVLRLKLEGTATMLHMCSESLTQVRWGFNHPANRKAECQTPAINYLPNHARTCAHYLDDIVAW